jgi:hypothetical protein
MSARPPAVLLVALAALAAACSGGSTKVVVSTPRATEPPITPVVGIVDVDRVVNAAVRGDVITLAELTQYSRPACTTHPDQPLKIGDPPACESGESDGDQVEALAVTGCDGGWARPAKAVAAFDDALGRGAEFLLAYAPKPAGFGAILGEQYVALFRPTGGSGELALHIKGGRISWVEHACPPDADLASADRVLLPLALPTASSGPAATPEASATP